MGVYIYAVRQRSINATWSYGVPVKVHLLTYLARAPMHYMDMGCNDGKIAQINRQWADQGVSDLKGTLVIEGTHAIGGASVIEYRYKNPCVADTDESFGKKVGHLHKMGRKWVIVPVQEQVGWGRI